MLLYQVLFTGTASVVAVGALRDAPTPSSAPDGLVWFVGFLAFVGVLVSFLCTLWDLVGVLLRRCGCVGCLRMRESLAGLDPAESLMAVVLRSPTFAVAEPTARPVGVELADDELNNVE